MSLNPRILERLRAWRASPLLFVQDAFDWSQVPQDGPSDQQADGLKRFLNKKRTSIRSGHGTGKDAWVSWIIYWFMLTRPYAKVACTAPTNRQLHDILWSELAKWHRLSVFKDDIIMQKDKIFYKESPKEWWCRAISPSVKATKEEQAETLAGLHAEHLLIIVDEASGVSDPTFVPLEGAMTQPDNRVVLIGNPTKNSGYFHDTQFDTSQHSKWTRLHWDSRKSSNVSDEMIEYFRDKYGEDSNVFRIRVKGEPPIDDANSFISLADALACVGNEFDVDPDWPLYLSVDVARYGEDKSIILPRRGNKIYPWNDFRGVNTYKLAQYIMLNFREMDAAAVGVDAVGIGGGVIDWLHEDPRGCGMEKAWEVNSYDAAEDNTKYHRLREQLYSKVKENCTKKKYFFPDEIIRVGGVDINIGNELAHELGSIQYKFDSKGAIQLESKEDAKKRGIKSPNIADALAISEYFHSLFFMQFSKKEKERKEKRIRKTIQPMPADYNNNTGRNNWQVA